jgi:hypothetical protein
MRRNDGGDAIRNAAEILTQADAALLQAENIMRRRPVADTEQCAASTAKAALFIPGRLAVDDGAPMD